MWNVLEDGLESIAIGAWILGTGGGGNPYIGMLRAKQMIRENGPVKVQLQNEFLQIPLFVDNSFCDSSEVDLVLGNRIPKMSDWVY